MATKLKGAVGSKKSKHDIGLDFSVDTGLDPIDIIRSRILQQAIIDYINAYKILANIKKFPVDISEWSTQQQKYVIKHYIKQIHMIADVHKFLKSEYFDILYDLNPDTIEAALRLKCKNTYGMIPGDTRSKAICEYISEQHKKQLKEREEKKRENRIIRDRECQTSPDSRL